LRISPEWIHISKIGKAVDQLQPLPRWAKKVGELWSTNKKVFGAHIDPPKSNFGAISDNYRLRSRISPERIHVSKIGKVRDQLQPLPRWKKKVCELRSTNKKVIGAHVDAPKWNFSRDYILARRGCWPSNFYMC